MPLIRILVRGNKISVESSHILTDGTGALEFLKSLLILYSKELNSFVPPDFEYLKPGDILSEEEYEDSYNRYFKEEIPHMVKRPKAFHLTLPLRSKPRFMMRNVIVSIKDIKELASGIGVNINDYLVSVHLFILQEMHEQLGSFSRYKKYKRIRIQVPVNLRNIIPSKTMRNFSLFVMPEIDLRLGHYTFDEIIKSVYHQIRLETDEKLIHKNIARNVGSERKIYVRSIPLVLKSFILRMKHYSLGISQYSGVVTNLGKISLPPETGNMIDYFVFTPPPPHKKLKTSCGTIGYGDKLVLSFGNITKSTDLEEKFLKFLKDKGLKVHLETNTYA